jgi:ribosomal protein L14
MSYVEGIMTGVAASLVVALLSLTVKEWLIPRVRAILYRGPDINGEWTSYQSDPNADEPMGFAEIVQKGTVASMKLTRTKSRSGKPVSRNFIYKGQFSEGQLTMLFEDERAKGYITGAIVLRLSTNTKALDGKTTYFDHNANAVVSNDLFFLSPKILTQILTGTGR